MNSLSYYIQTYGCQMNEADSEAMARLLERAGYAPASQPEEAAIIILNTCCVRAKPEQKVYSRLGELRAIKEKNPDLIIAVAGCMAQKEGLAMLKRVPYVDMVIGTRQFHRLEEFLHSCRQGGQRICALGLEDDPSIARTAPSPPASIIDHQVKQTTENFGGGVREPRRRALCLEFLGIPSNTEGQSPPPTSLSYELSGPIQQQNSANLKAFVPIILGCDNYCTYCIVPSVRGRQKSRLIEELRKEVSELVARGCKEVTLLGQNVLAYGRDLPDGRDFVSLLEDLNSLEGLERIRFTTAHPRDVHDRLIEAVANLSKVCEHLHLPIQAGQDRLLQAMNRGYTTAYYLDMAQKIRARMPDAAITTDIMVGFPGETEEEFAASMAFYEKLAFDQAFMFIYSPRPGTPAAKMAEQIPYKVKQARLAQLVELVNTNSIRINRTWIGRTEEVLVDEVSEKDATKISGRLRNNKMVVFPGQAERVGQFAQVKITGAHLWGLTGEAK